MNHFFLVRRGLAEGEERNYCLSIHGQGQMEQLGIRIMELQERNIMVVTSEALAARQSAQVLTELLGIRSAKGTLELWADFDCPNEGNYRGNPERVHQYLEPYMQQANIVVAITHNRILKTYPPYFMEKFRMNPLEEEGITEKYLGMYVNIRTKEHGFLPIWDKAREIKKRSA